MTQDLAHAFSPPEHRAAATDRLSRDRIAMRDHLREVEIGAFQEERGIRQRLRFDVVLEILPPDQPVGDDVDRILSYDTIVEAVDQSLAEERVNLLETLAERIAGRLLAEPRAVRVFVRIDKLDRGPFALGVEIERARLGGAGGVPVQPAVVAPVLVYLGAQAIADARLPDWLDQLLGLGRPVVLTVDLPDLPRPKAANALAQRRIDLLALEQNAWVLAGADRRCVVVGSRTELAHALRPGRVVVWAPSKIVLDSVEGPDAGPGAPDRLSAWFASTLGAVRRLALGADLPGGERLDLRDRLAL